eukprot:PRCOL_00001314-RA
MSKHTIILMQTTPNKKSRTYDEFETVALAMDGLCQTFESKLKELNPNIRNITYDITDLYTWVDRLPDLGAMVWNPQTQAYTPYNKDWLKQKIFQHLKKQARQ